MSTRNVVKYIEVDGTSPFRRWFERLNAVAAAKVSAVLYRMAQGNLSSVKPVGQGVAEYRIDFGPGYRVYIGQQADTVVILLGGGIKKGQHRDIRLAQERWARYKTGKR